MMSGSGGLISVCSSFQALFFHTVNSVKECIVFFVTNEAQTCIVVLFQQTTA